MRYFAINSVLYVSYITSISCYHVHRTSATLLVRHIFEFPPSTFVGAFVGYFLTTR